MDRASLVRRRQQIREKENVATESNTLLDGAKTAVVKKKKATKRSGSTRSAASEDLLCEAASLNVRSELGPSESRAVLPLPPPPAREKRPARSSKQPKSTKAVYSAETNAGLVVRQLLQRSQLGDVKEFLQSVTKTELFQQALVVATYVQDLKKKHAEVSDDVDAELVQYQSKYRTAISDLSERERICEEQESEKVELLDRLKTAQEEYQSLIAWIRSERSYLVEGHRDALEKRKADEFREMDLELRHLNQTLSRLRIEWESEKSQREKAEARLQKLSTFLDETKAHTTSVEEESQQLKTQLNEEKEARTTKDHALQIAHRDLQALQKNCRELENAKLDAQSEVASLVQRMKAIRRDHLALLHRVEAPTQLAAQWHAKMQDNQRTRS
ncbi:hypothetical protein KRP22_014140 [Phytophthora ramorum]|nr:hypothetical protein KRP22_9261 [Phytophthora ramorum]